MHPNPIYRQAATDQNLSFAADRGFGVLSVNGPEGPLAAHIPFVVKDAQTVELHLVRSNPIARTLGSPQPALLAVTGADSYISPDWYGLDDQVPTWNYIAVHLRGMLELLPQDALRPMLDDLSDAFEQRLLPKPIWKTDKVSAETMDRFMRMIVPLRLTITSVDGTWKLGQNKPDHARHAAADGVEAHGIGSDTARIAALMHAATAKEA